MNKLLSDLENNKKVYMASDFHLGIPSHLDSLMREQRIIRWLDKISEDAEAIILLGDVFDFWFEYRQVVPKGFVRFLGKLGELSDRGIKLILFTGNHDLWLNGYLQTELNAILFKKPESFQIGSHRFYLAHGDGLGPGDRKFKFYKKIFVNPICQWLFRWLHPDVGISLAKYWSSGSRLSQINEELTFHGDKEWLVVHSNEVEKNIHHDYYVYGHRHLAVTHPFTEDSTYVNLGEWVSGSSYAVYDGRSFELKNFSDEN